jgi:hypothetical protein
VRHGAAVFGGFHEGDFGSDAALPDRRSDGCATLGSKGDDQNDARVLLPDRRVDSSQRRGRDNLLNTAAGRVANGRGIDGRCRTGNEQRCE